MVENKSVNEKIALPSVIDISTIHTWHKELVLLWENRNLLTFDASLVKKK